MYSLISYTIPHLSSLGKSMIVSLNEEVDYEIKSPE